MPHTGGTYEATAVTTRQWVGTKLAKVAALLMWLAAIGGWAYLAGRIGDSGLNTVTENDLFLGAWSYLYGPLDVGSVLIGYTHPPILLWVGLAAWAFLGGIAVSPTRAIAAAKGKSTNTARRSRLSNRDEARNLTRQLHERGRAGLFGRGTYVWLGLGLAGAGLVLVTALLGPTPLHLVSGLTMHGTQKGLLPWVCLVGSLIALVGLLLSFPYGRREKVVVDVLGNVRGADEPVVPLSSVPPPPPPPPPA